MVRAHCLLHFYFCWGVYSLPAGTVGYPDILFLVYHDRGFPPAIHILEVAQTDQMAEASGSGFAQGCWGN